MTGGQWYPGSMSRAINQMREDLKAIDLVIEMLDARIPYSSRNPAFSGLFKNKRHLLLLHKADRAESEQTEAWLSYFIAAGKEAIAFSVQRKQDLHRLFGYLKKEESRMRSGRFKRPLRMIFVGIPNVGKSTLINLFVRKAVTRTGNRPGITRGKQWIRILPGMELLDTPGLLRPNIKEDTVRPLAVVGAIPGGRVDLHEAAMWLLDRYLEKGKLNLLMKKYPGLKPGTAGQLFEQVGFSQGCLQSANKIDTDRTAALLLRDFQSGALGRLTLEEAPLRE